MKLHANIFCKRHDWVAAGGLQAFLNSGRALADFRPVQAGHLQLSVDDQCRIRDRSTIMARHLYAERGDVFADAQVASRQLLVGPGPCTVPLMIW